MPVSSAVSVHHNFNGEFEKDFSVKLRLIDKKEDDNDVEPQQNEQEQVVEVGVEDEEEEEEEEEEEFSFVCMNPDGSPVSADDLFQNGQIRPFFPLFNRDLLFSDDDEGSEARTSSSSSSRSLRPPLKNLFVEEGDHASSSTEPEGPYCTWTRKAVETSPQVCKKSNSTGSSKLRRFRELVLRSNSDGKDAFVFLHHQRHNNDRHNSNSSKIKTKAEKGENVEEQKEKMRGEQSAATAATAHEKLYMRNRAAKEEHKRKSYLPYRVGFFTHANGFSRNVHPY